jgi:HemY protein
MIRLIVFLLVTVGLAFTAAWLADRPGEVSIDWLGYHADTSVAILIGCVLAIVCAALIAWTLLVYLMDAPARLAQRAAQRRAARGHHAITRGLVAIGAGDLRAALKHANEAARHAADQPLTLLLQAQTAQLSGARGGADAAFRAMADQPETKLLGLHGLFVEAQRRNDVAAARGYAEEAAKAAPSLAWAGQAAFDFHCADGNWPGALEALERNSRGGLVDKDTYRRQRAVLLAARALSLENTDRATASELAQEAVKQCPGLVPAAALAGRLLAGAGDRRKAGRILEAAWREGPHPDIADAYADLVPGASARERLARIRTLARLVEGHLESRLAVARAALDAREFAEARASLKPLVAAPTRRVATLMAQLEEADTGDIGRAREWMARAVHAALDPVWTADGLIAENWMPVSPATGRLDAFQWRVPVADLTPRGPLLEPAPSRPAIAAPVIPEVMPAAKEAKPEIRIEPRPAPKPDPKPEPKPEPKSAPKTEFRTEPKSELKPPEPRLEPKSEPKPEPRSEPRHELRPEFKPEARSESAAEAAIETMPGPSSLDQLAPPASPEAILSAGAAAIAVPDDPGPEPEAPEPKPKPAANAGGGLLSWFSRNAAG